MFDRLKNWLGNAAQSPLILTGNGSLALACLCLVLGWLCGISPQLRTLDPWPFVLAAFGFWTTCAYLLQQQARARARMREELRTASPTALDLGARLHQGIEAALEASRHRTERQLAEARARVDAALADAKELINQLAPVIVEEPAPPAPLDGDLLVLQEHAEALNDALADLAVTCSIVGADVSWEDARNELLALMLGLGLTPPTVIGADTEVSYADDQPLPGFTATPTQAHQEVIHGGSLEESNTDASGTPSPVG